MQTSNERISELILTLLREQATEAELAELEAWRLRSPEHAVFIDKMLAEGYVDQGVRDLMLARQRSARLLADKDIFLSAGSVAGGRIHFLSSRWSRYAAAIILVLGIGGAVWYGVSRSGGQEIAAGNGGRAPVQSDVLPGGDKAVLTLADGSRIALDSAANGDLAQQGGMKIVKTDSGKLAYFPGTDMAGGVSYNSISTPRGGQYQIVLPDGSRVWLNAASSIRFPTRFTGAVRLVEMTGEAYMEIAKNSRQSFIVMANGVEVQALGTSFNINAYADEAAIKTTVVGGSVKVKAASGSVRSAENAAILKPGQQALVWLQSLHVVDTVDLDKVVAWKNGLFNFNGAGVGEVMRQLSRWYDIDVVYDKDIPNIEFVGKMSRHVSLSGVLKGLQGAGMHFRIENGKRLVIFP